MSPLSLMNDKPVSLKHFVFYFLFAIVHLGAITVSEYGSVVMISKSLLMPALMIVFYRLTRNRENRHRKLVFAALILSWIGDMVLLFQQSDSTFFLIGLASFLLAHIFYIISFSFSISNEHVALLKRKPWLILFFFLYASGIFMVVYHQLGSMLIPVIVYMCVILTMGLAALNRYGRVAQRSFIDVFIGACLFILSDSLLAINKFYMPFALASFLIMITYINAQFFIVRGMIEEV